MCCTLSFILQGFLLTGLAYQCYGRASTSFSCQQQAKPGLPFNITCHISGNLTNGISWLRPGFVLAVDCSGAEASTCLTNIPGYTTAFGDATVNILNIAVMTANDEGNWTCRDGGSGPPGCEIVSSRLPDETASSVALDPGNSLEVNDNLNIIVILIDYYCSKSVSFYISLNGNQVPLTGIPSTDSVFHNASTEVTVQVTKNMAGPIKMAMGCGGRMFDVIVQGLTSLDIATPPSTPDSASTTTSSPTRTLTTDTTDPTNSKHILLLAVVIPVACLVIIILVVIVICIVHKRSSRNDN